MKKGVFKRIKQVSIFVFICVLPVLLGTCKQYKADLREYLSYWASQAFVVSADIKSAKQNDSGGIPSVGSLHDAEITLTLQNPKNFTLIMPSASEKREIVSFAKLGAGITPKADSDYTLTQPESGTLKLVLKKAFLQKAEWGLVDISPTITLYPTDGRKFINPFTFEIKSNTAPPLIKKYVVAKTESGGKSYYVLCLTIPDMDKTVPGGLLHKDLASIEINGTAYTLKVADEQTGFVKPAGGDFLSVSEVEPLNVPDAEAVPTGKWVLYYKTAAVIEDGATAKSYTIQLKDDKGLSSPVFEAQTKQNKVKAVTVTFDPAAHKGRGTADDPYIIALSDTEAQAKVTFTSDTAGTTVHCLRGSGGDSQTFDGNPVSIPLPLEGNYEKDYTIEYFADGNGFIPTEKKKIHLKCAVIHTVTFDTKGGSVVEEQKIIHGQYASEPAPAPVKTGWTLDGWYREEAYSTQWNFTSDAVERDITLYAKWKPNGTTPYTVIHRKEKVDGSFDETIENLTGTTDTPATVTLKNEAGFEDGTYTSAPIAGDGSTVIRVEYKRKTITVTFKPAGGILDGNTDNVVKRGKFGAALTAPAKRIRTGYTFTTWNPPVPSEFPADNAEYTAQWRANTNTPYKVIHRKEKVSDGYDETTENLTGTTDTIAAVTLKNEAGFADGTYIPATIKGDGSTVITVTYMRKQITVTFKPAGGTLDGTIGNVVKTGKFGAVLTAPPAPARAGYTFTTWNPSVPSEFPADNAEYTAQWTANTYKVKFNGNGNDSGNMPDQSFAYDETKTLTANSFIKTGHTFQGWAKTPNGAKEYDNQQPVSNLTAVNNGTVNLYAVWKINEYAITFRVEGGTGGTLQGAYNGYSQTASGGETKTLTVPHGASVTFTAAPSEGWEVESWSGGVTVMSLNTIATLTVTAPATVTVKFKDNIEISGNTSGAWKKLKEEAAKPHGASTIVIDGTIKATSASGDNGEITIGRNLTVKPKSGTAELDANQQSGIFKVGSAKTLTLKDGVTLKNGKAGSGGGVHVEAGGTFNMQGGTITACTATVNGGGVYVASGSTFTMSGSAKVDENNEVYLAVGRFITVTGPLNHEPAAKIKPANYARDRVLAKGGSARAENFTVAPDTDGNNWRYKKVGNEVKFVTATLTVTFTEIKCVVEHDDGPNGEYYWTMKVDGSIVHKRPKNNLWVAGDNTTLPINKSFTRSFSYFPASIPVDIEIWEHDDSFDDHVGTTKAHLTYNYDDDQWKWAYDGGNWNTNPKRNEMSNPNVIIGDGGEEIFTEQYRTSNGDTDVTIKISWRDE